VNQRAVTWVAISAAQKGDLSHKVKNIGDALAVIAPENLVLTF